ncbi:MAG TPA: glycosyltransferase family 4 protein [Candidatus Sulfotelmatobacter sp.]|nr:glycosyltransferase family 4 protein [Candidatus Sulfotelmatobacter sp.]
MRICFVTPRYGADIVGGAERLVRDFAERLVTEGHQIVVLTTCARNHFTWANELEPGQLSINGVTVRRYPVTIPKDQTRMARLQVVIDSGLSLPPRLQREWVTNTGFSQPLFDAIDGIADSVDAVCFAPYLFASTVFGAVVRPERSVVIPCMHDEPYARFHIVQATLQRVAGLLFNSEEERSLACSLLPSPLRTAVVGVGFDPVRAHPDRFRARHQLTGDLVMYAGRRESGKNYPLLLECVSAYDSCLSRNGPVRLVAVGSGDYDPPPAARAWICDLGFLSEEEKQDALAAATAIVNLSVNESLSYVVLEGWLSSVPAIVHANCAVTRGHCERSGGGLWIRDVEEFAEALDRLREQPRLRNSMGAAGNHYVRDHYSWPVVLRRFTEAIVELVASGEPTSNREERDSRPELAETASINASSR